MLDDSLGSFVLYHRQFESITRLAFAGNEGEEFMGWGWKRVEVCGAAKSKSRASPPERENGEQWGNGTSGVVELGG